MVHLQLLGLYKHTHCSGYADDPGDSSYDELLAIDDDADALIARWNNWQDNKRQKIKDAKKHESYLREVPPNFKPGCKSLSYSGNTGGGWAAVEHTITIKKIPQFDK